MAQPPPALAQASTFDLASIRENDINTLYTPAQGVHVAADIVFVHGVGGHPVETWRHVRMPKGSTSKLSGRLRFRSRHREKEVDTVEDQQSRSSCFWPLELLPKSVPNARLFTYGYDSHPIRFGQSANRMFITQHAEDLLSKVTRERTECSNRPLMFVAHSLGGIIVKGAIAESLKMDTHEDRYNMAMACKALFFFGTPHHGASAAEIGETLRKIFSTLPAGVSTYGKVLEGLAPGSETLYNISKDFNNVFRTAVESGKRVRICSFHETKGMSTVKGLGGEVHYRVLVSTTTAILTTSRSSRIILRCCFTTDQKNMLSTLIPITWTCANLLQQMMHLTKTSFMS